MANDRKYARAEKTLREYALSYPETVEEFPWEHSAFKVNGKIFLSLVRQKGMLRLSVKLPVSNTYALSLPFASPTGYGLGKSGWVTAQFDAGMDVPVEMIKEWVDESFRAVAPKRVVALLEGKEGDDQPGNRQRGRKATTKSHRA